MKTLSLILSRGAKVAYLKSLYEDGFFGDPEKLTKREMCRRFGIDMREWMRVPRKAPPGTYVYIDPSALKRLGLQRYEP